MDIEEIVGLISVDIRKAFDSIDHKILLKKMQEQFGIRDLELKWFQSYLTNRTKFVSLTGIHHQLWKLYVGFHEDLFWDHLCSYYI